MPRPRRCRRIWMEPEVDIFLPGGVSNFEEIILTFDEHEALRLVDKDGLSQEEAAKKMNISQPTLSRLLRSARAKVATAITTGRAIRIEGGVYEMAGAGYGRGRGRQGGFGLGPGGYCVCPNCGYRVPHQRGSPCYVIKCPKCGAQMTRG
ncbi:hypothetical protein DRN74_02695 [Candidatus Micrarchaeota archaeon]|nr:MAG: hypothetical protein DRN74_02695 [Candidatus Micrarchaeota archaeon]